MSLTGHPDRQLEALTSDGPFPRMEVPTGVRLGVVVFLAGQAALGVVTDVDAVPVRDPEYSVRAEQLRQLRSAHPGRPVVVVLGTSRSMVGVNAGRLSEGGGAAVYNFGQPGAGPVRQWLTWKRLVSAGLKPDALAVEVLPALFSRTGQEIFESSWNDVSQLSLGEAVELLPRYARRWNGAGRWALARAVPLSRYSTSAYRDYYLAGPDELAGRSPTAPSDPYGWRPGFLQSAYGDERRARTTDKLLRQYRLACADANPAPAEPLFDRFLAEARSAQVPTVAFVMPECRRFREQSGGLVSVVPRLREVCAGHGVPFVNAADWMPDDAFWDGHHLHGDQAEPFTGRFGREVLGRLPATPHGSPIPD